MKSFLKLTGMKRSGKATIIFVAISCFSFIVALLVGISENPPGIALFYLAITTLILAFVHTWREVRNFMFLAGTSLIGLPLFVVLHNLLDAVFEISADISILSHLLEGLSALFFLLAIIACPPAFLIGVVGAAIMYVKKRQSADEIS